MKLDKRLELLCEIDRCLSQQVADLNQLRQGSAGLSRINLGLVSAVFLCLVERLIGLIE